MHHPHRCRPGYSRETDTESIKRQLDFVSEILERIAGGIERIKNADKRGNKQ